MTDQERAKVELQIEALRLLARDVTLALDQPAGQRPAALQALLDEAGGRMWFASGTYHVRLGTVAATATAGYLQAAEAWRRAALRKRETLGKSLS